MDNSRSHGGVPRRRSAPAIVLSIVFMAAFLPIAHFVDGGEIFGGLIVVPMALIAWSWGLRAGIIAAAAGVTVAEAVFAVEHFLFRHRGLTFYWLAGTLVGFVVIPFIVTIVGKLSESIGKQKRAESALRESEEHFRDIFMNAPFGYFRTTPGGKVIYGNPTLARMLGYDSPREFADAVNARGIGEALYEDPRQRDHLVAAALESPQWRNHEVRLRRRDGAPVVGSLFVRSYRPHGAEAPVVEGFLEDVTERRTAEEEAARSRRHLEAVLSAVPDVMFELDRSGRLHACRARGPHHVLSDPGRCLGRPISDFLPREAAASIMEALEAAAASQGRDVAATYRLSIDGRDAWFELSMSAIGDPRDPDCHFIALSRDVTDRKNLEQQLLQSQKMEAVGRLAGGIAHDFNNILMVILGFCDLIEAQAENAAKVRDDLVVIRDSARRAAALTAQLLAFSRKQMLQPKVLDVPLLVHRMERMLAGAVGDDIALSVVPSESPATVRADEGQLQQVIMNLAVNARDAMPRGGRLTIAVDTVVFDEGDPQRPPEMSPARYVRLSVSDTGVGMNEETTARLFEPFFTTKELGKGTGLGLSIVYGIVKQSEGYIYVESREGAGTTFRIYLPSTDREAGEPPAPPEAPSAEHGWETVLLVEDDDAVRSLIRRSLEARGYTVMEARGGREALRLCNEWRGEIHLLLTDVVMLGVSGAKVAEEFRRLNPDAPVILMTGYAQEQDVGRVDNSFVLLNKPLSMSELLGKVRQALAGRRA